MHAERRDHFIRALRDRGVSASVVHTGTDKNYIFGEEKQDLTEQRRFERTQVHIPIYYGLTNEQVEYVIESIRKGW
jgi:perosamine synthetase